jgi:type I restriction-modification system DNA methylase subunit
LIKYYILIRLGLVKDRRLKRKKCHYFSQGKLKKIPDERIISKGDSIDKLITPFVLFVKLRFHLKSNLMNVSDFNSFVEYCNKHIHGDEKGEAQLFLDHFFNALGYTDGLKGAGANCEFRIRDDLKGSTKFADLVWKPIVLIEMKKRDTDLSLHYQQAFDYWTKLVPDRPKYVVLCNFDEFWIYDLNQKVYDPLEKIPLSKITERQEAFAFLLPKPRTPIFNYNKEDVTEKAAYYVSNVYRSMKNRDIELEVALKYCLQMVLCLFAEDVGLLPNQIFTRLIKELLNEPGNGPDKVTKSYDLISGLFTAMNTVGTTPGGMYKDVEYFNGGLFDRIYPIELTKYELTLIEVASSYNWQHVNPAIFGSIFEFALDEKERHKLGAHYTHEIDIKKIVVPVIVQPWTEKIENAKTLDEYYSLIEDLSNFKVLDPACGSGNFLFIAFKEMKLLEKKLLQLIREHSTKSDEAKRLVQFLQCYKFVTTSQFFGIDIKSFAVELAKVTLMIAKELSWLEAKEAHDNKYKALPLDNLDKNIVCCDALLNEDGTQKVWPEADAIIGNPPYQSKNKMQKEFGAKYLSELRAAYPEVPGRADFCVYWFYKAHQQLKQDSYAGLVGTNTIRQNYSREGSLDYIVKHGGTIVDAVTSEEWGGDAVVFVSIVNWKKGNSNKDKVLWYYDNRNELHRYNSSFINSSLSIKIDVTSALQIKKNIEPKTVFQGQTHGNEGFLMQKSKAIRFIDEIPEYSNVLKPFLIADELIGNYKSQPSRFVIDFTGKDLIEASKYNKLLSQLELEVLPEIREKAEQEQKGLIKTNGREAWLNTWWLLWRRREDMLKTISKIGRYISCSRVTKRPIFEFVSSFINPNDALMVFGFEDDYSFGIISSLLHWIWFVEKCSTLKGDWRYTTESVWDTFPWPQNPSSDQIEKVAQASLELRNIRNVYMEKNKLSLRDLYRTLEKPGKNILKDLHQDLDKSVIEAYGFDPDADLLQQLLDLNLSLYQKEKNNKEVQGPGIPKNYMDHAKLISKDCVQFDPKIK